MNFAKFVDAVTKESTRFDAILRIHSMELDTLAKQFRVRHTGVYKWFQTYMRSSPVDNSLIFQEFEQAVRNLCSQQIMPQTIQDIFTNLDEDKDNKVAITDIESLFKEHNRRANPQISTAQVCCGILRAFNGDVQFIDNELQSLTMQNGG